MAATAPRRRRGGTVKERGCARRWEARVTAPVPGREARAGAQARRRAGAGSRPGILRGPFADFFEDCFVDFVDFFADFFVDFSVDFFANFFVDFFVDFFLSPPLFGLTGVTNTADLQYYT